MNVVAVVGLSGVGKTTAICGLADQLPFLHLQASPLIKAEQTRRGGITPTSEQLRTGPVIDNQELLISGFKEAAKDHTGLVVFDGHVIIDAGSSVIEIPSIVFERIGCQRLIVLTEEPAELMRRRAADAIRKRPIRSLVEIRHQQKQMIDVAERIAAGLGISCSVHRASYGDALKNELQTLL